MAVMRPSEVKQRYTFSENEEKRISWAEERIDAKINALFDRFSQAQGDFTISSSIPDDLGQKLEKEIARRYHRAGWEVSFTWGGLRQDTRFICLE